MVGTADKPEKTIGRNGEHLEPATSHEDRPTARYKPPFRVYRDGLEITYIECLHPIHGELLPFTLSPNPSTPWHDAILDLLQAYFAMEAKVDGLMAERDKLVIELAQAQKPQDVDKQVRDLRKAVGERDRQIEELRAGRDPWGKKK